MAQGKLGKDKENDGCYFHVVVHSKYYMNVAYHEKHLWFSVLSIFQKFSLMYTFMKVLEEVGFKT